ncbi:acyl-CoA thioesterase [Pelosinus sp. sgz500959]|uniref:acyl-CoA thioesterase n=1 Tax=Pelosinus sp. sgz500959 TaxID=3242472 RepID=UPI00366E2034
MINKKIQNSAVVMSMVMLPHQANVAGNVHGGEIMKLMDNAAYVVAHRHARANVVTARVDELAFHHPILVGNLVICHAHLTFVGTSSMEVTVVVEVEDLYKESSQKCALSAYFTMVALNAGGHPMKVPSLELTTEEEKIQFNEGQKRYEEHKGKVKNCHVPRNYQI